MTEWTRLELGLFVTQDPFLLITRPHLLNVGHLTYNCDPRVTKS